jgi:DNA-binding LacI/PurR family transcriptional regulator
MSASAARHYPADLGRHRQRRRGRRHGRLPGRARPSRVRLPRLRRQEYWDLERLEGYRSGPARHGIDAAARSIVKLRTTESIHGAVRRLLYREHRPSAIITGNDVLAAGAVNEVKSMGLCPGSDVAVTGFDGGLVREMTEPVLTSVRVPVDVIATELISRCLREIDDGPTGAPGLLVPTENAVGASA